MRAPLQGRGGPAARAGAFAAAALAAASCSLLLDFEGSAAPPDAGLPDAASLSEACDTLEPNGVLDEAAPADAGTYELGLCDGDRADFLAFDLTGSEDLEVSISFEFEEGRRDLELRLYDRASENALETVTASSGTATLERSSARANALPAGSYAIGVAPGANVTDPALEILYDLELTY